MGGWEKNNLGGGKGGFTFKGFGGKNCILT